ncbi:Methylthiotransferase N-terminal domain protein [Acididesulfobacillus acetoxydans]|uniref:Threonylcarbamoyladenosine tRNA methylthiotransferase MtaB n=1 Tax=Acididesulfobacillus acetoxydans TaxID=1561005 RepID=A0A8S0X7Q8_9FIRM|nr:tRNA (N(6)-L-threonylcarbamoyladenosine(37)-C(2))-methylthiotransferase MtaB [Acididesulfobacillus acetoxydans]CAA7603480.1 Methylthiotransferase N-terminal domain protein [Acididesulfobacillus acetoxydans]CEJ06817.1 Threonylcarbamoyladenosine tRNA methylthiotransferase MtaB [Acididesulfobacillus acetoxydans]
MRYGEGERESYVSDNYIIKPEGTRTVRLVTLGCKVNQTESEAVAQIFRDAGYQVRREDGPAEVVVINTCTVTNSGDSKSRQTIRRMIKAYPGSFVIVMGCYAQTSPGEVLKIEGVDLVVGTQDRGRILELMEAVRAARKPRSAVHDIGSAKDFEELPLLEGESRTRATLKIEDGCNQFCTYCIIPYARGPVRSRRPENVLAEARKLVSAGYKEIVVTGIHTGAYGRDLTENWDLARLVEGLGEIPGLRRLRLSSIEPVEFTSGLIETIRESKVVCRHLHIPLQSGSETVLRRMHRPYTPADYKRLLERLREAMPGLAITTDVIVGFPGETEEDWQEALTFVESCGFAGIHVFPYSRREGTPAARYPGQISHRVKQRRAREMLALARAGRERYKRAFVGKTVEVLLETVDADGSAFGHSGNYLGVRLPPVPAGGSRRFPGMPVEVALAEENLDLDGSGEYLDLDGCEENSAGSAGAGIARVSAPG